MTSPPAIDPRLKSHQLDAIHTSISDTGPPLQLHGLDTARSLLGGTHAWVTRHAGDTCQIVNLLGTAMEIDSSLYALLVHASQNSRERPVLAMRWRDDTLLCASLSTEQEADGCTYMLNMLFDGQFELTSSLEGFVDGLRCSMQALISFQLSKHSVESAETPAKQIIYCTCCLRYHSFERGWMHWDHASNLRDVHGSFRSVCEKCALALYSEVLQD